MAAQLSNQISVVALDADDTLWHNETFFVSAQNTFAEIVAPWTPDDVDALIAHEAAERRNLGTYGYGIKGFTLSMIETAIEITDGQITAQAIDQILRLGREMIAHPVDLLDGVPDALELLATRFRLVLITKGELMHQEQKVATSGLAEMFERVDIVSEKDPPTYAAILRGLALEPEQFCMIGNSVRSDVLPPIELGANAIHVPYELTWAHETVSDSKIEFQVCQNLGEAAEILVSS